MRRTPVTRSALLLLLCGCLLPLAGASAEIEGVHFADTAQIGKAPVPIQGVGLLRYRVLIKAYVAAFYAEGESPVVDPLGRAPRRLEIEYFWPLQAGQFAEATRQGMAANLSPQELAALQPGIRQINALYEDVEPGDRYALTYADARTELSKNGRALGSVEGEDFGRAIFAIWLGDAPLSQGLKNKLLARRR